MKQIALIVFLVTVLTIPGWTRYGEDSKEDSNYDSGDSYYPEQRERDFLGWQENAGIRGQIWQFMRDPQGLSIQVGMSKAKYNNIFWGTNDERLGLTDDSGDLLNLLIGADRMWGPKVGFKLGAAYLDLFFSPYWGNTNTLYIEAESGVWMLADSDDYTGLSYRVGIFFYGSVLSFKNSILPDPSWVTSYTYSEAMQLNGGWGYVNVGLGAPAMIGYKVVNIPIGDVFTLPYFQILFGVFIRAGVLLPNFVDFGWGLLGPDLKLSFVDHLSVYMKLRPFKTSYHTARFEFGLEVDF